MTDQREELSDIVERANWYKHNPIAGDENDCRALRNLVFDMADEIERLRGENFELAARQCQSPYSDEYDFISRQLDRLINEVGTLRDEVRVLSAIVMRLDTGQSAVLAEQRATRDQLARMDNRIRKLEDDRTT